MSNTFLITRLTLVLGLFLTLDAVAAFSPQFALHVQRPVPSSNFLVGRQSSFLFQSSNDFDKGSTSSSKRRKRRVKRKDQADTDESESSQASSSNPERKPREDAAVNLQVTDVRNLVGGTSSAPSSPSAQKSTSSDSSAGTAASSASSSSSANSEMDSLEMLLQDAKEIQEFENKESGGLSGTSDGDGDGELSIPDTLRKILSTIVTVDFFVVCGFLLWFLLGIFCSYILKDDTVQIAFNQLFQPVVQPALGILMIGSIVGSIGQDDEGEVM